MSDEQTTRAAPTSPPPPAAAGTAERERPGRLHSLTGLRFVAAGGVVTVHATIYDGGTTVPVSVLWLGASSVSLFFILSGYVLTHSWRPSDSPRSFWRRRAAKILPNHVVTWAGALLLTAAIGASLAHMKGGAGSDMAALFLVHTWVPDDTSPTAGNPVSWSLAAEALFYALFPFLAPLVARLGVRGCVVLAGGCLAAMWAVPFLCDLFVDPATFAGMPRTHEGMWFLYFFPLTRLPQFLLGVAVARLSMLRPNLPRFGVLPATALVAVALFGGPAVLPDAFMWAAATTLPLVLLVHSVAELDLREKRSLLRTRPAVFLGDISYALYLVHCQVLVVVDHMLTERGASQGLVVAVAVPLMLLASWQLYTAVERPAMRLLARPRAGGRRRIPAHQKPPVSGG